tara:strand:- start:269 stop:523 length:255 start_codon:yes stop_codon:yes gene_type:complete
MIDENPSQEDIDRFSSDTASCAYCGAEIYDDCLECPECRAKNRSPFGHHKGNAKFEVSKKVGILFIILLLVTFFWSPIKALFGL